ncbi:methyl-accepting chemotaxis protein [Aliamphritea ceti]|uniref:methyl-accepting chemotaxis protein n=1 Tax=Aliamphritea ceti TaxID=1524258 RepID=UPI0021C2CA91|nr:methyl-accepting chemotaxis protein [Aliamphritea ceti]
MKINITHKASIGYLIILIMTVVAATILYNATHLIRDKVNVFVDDTLPALNHIQDINLSLNELEITAYELYGTSITPDQFASRAASELEHINAAVSAYQSIRGNDMGQLQGIVDSVSNSLGQLQQTMSASNKDWDKARNQLADLSARATDGKNRIAEIKQMIQEDANAGVAEVSNMLGNEIQLLFVLIILILAVVIAAFIVTKRLVAAPILSLSNDIDVVASSYNLRHEVKTFAEDEIGDAAQRLNALLGTFRTAMTEVNNAAQGTQAAVSTLSSVATTSDQQIDNLSQMIDELMDTTRDLEGHIKDQVVRSEAAAEAANKGADEVDKGASEMQRTSDSIDELANDVEKASNELMQLHETSNQVGQVVSTIADIAEQTNLLALNAAIEAARAGESGRGFAVVADEVRTLATRTHQSTAEINEMLAALVQSINTVVNSMQSGREKASASVELGQNMVTVLNEIRASILSLSEESHQVATETERAGEQVSSIAGDVQQFCSIGKSVAEDSQRIKTEAHSLNDHGNTLNNTVARFKV